MSGLIWSSRLRPGARGKKRTKRFWRKYREKLLGWYPDWQVLHSTYEDKCKEIGLETLEQRREKQDLLQTCKIFKTNNKNGDQSLLVRNKRQNGAATCSTTDPWSLVVPRSRLEIRKHSFTARAPVLWNKLPVNLRAFEDPKMFIRAMKSINTGMGGGPHEIR